MSASKVTVDRYGERDSEDTEPLVFIGDDLCGPPLYTSTDSMMGFSTDPCWIEHMRIRSKISVEERGWKKPSKKDWVQWEKACEEAFVLSGAGH